MVIISEIKWRKLNKRDKDRILYDLEKKWERTSLSKKYKGVVFEALDSTNL